MTKAVIPAAGLGTRFLPATKAQPKEMLPLVDKPAIQYVVEEAVAAGITDVLMITGRSKRSLEDHFDRSFELEYFLEQKGKTQELEEMRRIAEMVNIHYIRQGEPKGLGHAIGVAAQHVGDQPFAVLLGDDIMHQRAGVLTGMLDAYHRHQQSIVALKPVSRQEIAFYGCAAAEPVEESVVRITDIVEKPDPESAPSDLAVMGRYILTPSIFEVLEKQEPGKGGEIQLTDAIKTLLGTEGVLGYTFTEGRFDTGNKLDYLRATVELALEREDLGPQFRAFLEQRLSRP
ncbi:UTP--glucose-1-phosphate uridylyltransferase GalU [Acidiferrimicrobium sp. IK]|nr:UTP--glucose-1-phosphate uridylyltransferase GalU [Acidiferrimicrobium sp. IK]